MSELDSAGGGPSVQDPAFGRSLRGLAGSWRGLAAPRPSAVVVEAPGLLAMRHPDPVLVNAVLLTPQALSDALDLFEQSSRSAVPMV
jgi:hypothetical protein